MNLLLRSPFFLLPFTIYLGVAGQAAGIYIFAIIWPAFGFGGPIPPMMRKKLFQLGLLLAGMWVIFPLFDLLNIFLHGSTRVDTLLNVGEKSRFVIHKSNLPSSILVSAISLLLLSLKKNKASGVRDIQPWRDFIQGSYYATIVFACYFFLQHITGFDFRRPSMYLSLANQMDSGLYRIYGLYGHTLSISAVSLALFVFWITLSFLKKDTDDSFYRSYIFLAALNMTFLLMTGGRTASVIGIIALLGFFAKSYFLKGNIKKSVLLGVSIIFVCSFIFWKIGIMNRVDLMISSLRKNEFEFNFTRVIFWEVYSKMFIDSPWIGHGAGRLSEFIRNAYYEFEGYGQLAKKYNAHNIYLEILADVGLFGFVFLCSSTVVFWKYWNKYFLAYLDGAIRVAFLLGFCANLLHGLTQNVFFDANVVAVYVAVFWVLLWESIWRCHSDNTSTRVLSHPAE